MAKPRVILTFHGIGDPQRRLEDGEHPYWVSESRFRDVIDLASSLRDEVDCEITVDDGNISDATIAGPYLAQQGFPTKFFVLAGRLGQAGSLDQAAVRDLTDMGHTIGSHGYDHRDWRTLDEQSYLREVHIARKMLQQLSAQPISAAAMPFGHYNRRVVAEIHRAGFECCYSCDGGPVRRGAWMRPRTSVRQDMSLQEIRSVLSGREVLSISVKRWIKGEIKKRL